MNRNLAKPIVVFTVALALVGGVALASNSKAATSSRYITVAADGTVKVTPDAVRLNATISVVEGTSKGALAAARASRGRCGFRRPPVSVRR